jgi:AhpD family alkylhydroperoxidase
MANFTESTDKQFVKNILGGAPALAKAWLEFDHSVGETESEIPFKYKELMSIAVALTTQCPYCLERHTEKAKKYGATENEIAETIMIAAALRSGAALGYGLLAMKLFSQEG